MPKTDDERRVRDYVEATLGARVVHCERQPRWRPAWFLDAERDGETLRLYFRGDRGISQGGAYELEHEMRCLQVLGAAGIPVPAVFGFCDAPRGILMERSAGRADLSTARDEAERHAVQDDYMRILARIHALDTAPFEAAGLPRPAADSPLALSDFAIWERGFRKSKNRPEPVLEFGIRWLHRHVPESRGDVRFVCCDSGQFMFENGRVTALLDLELAHLGDPAEDLAGLRTRDLSEPLGDLRRAIATYEHVTGRPVDRRLVDYHTIRFALVTPMAIAPMVAAPPRGVDLVQYLCWYHVYSRAPLEVIAHMQGVTLEPPNLPEADTTRHSVAHDALVTALQPPPRHEHQPPRDAERFAAYQTDAALRIAEYLRRAERFGAALEADDLAEVATLIGRTPRDWRDADLALEAWVEAADPERDADLIRYFHRRTLRQESLLAPVMRELADARIQMLD